MFFFLSVLTLLLMTAVSCKREPLELYYKGTAKVYVDVDWMSKFGEKPTGMTVMLAKDGDSITYTDITNDVDNYSMELEPGTYKMLIFNLTTGEFGSMGFANTKSFNNIFTYARQQEHTTDFWDVNVSYMREPEAIGCVVDTFTVLPDMIDGEPRFVYYKDLVPTEFEGLFLHEVIEPMTTELFVRVKVIGINYMAGMIGNISGMADGFLPSQYWRRTQSGYHLLDNWQRVADPNTDNSTKATREEEDYSTAKVGYLATRVRTFGLPNGRELTADRDSTSNMLSLCFTLIDDTKHVFRYAVGKKIKYRRGDVDAKGAFWKADVALELDLLLEAPFYEDPIVPNLPYAQPKGTGAFDAEVSPWGDEENVDVPM
jgi:hypothetical protein